MDTREIALEALASALDRLPAHTTLHHSDADEWRRDIVPAGLFERVEGPLGDGVGALELRSSLNGPQNARQAWLQLSRSWCDAPWVGGPKRLLWEN